MIIAAEIILAIAAIEGLYLTRRHLKNDKPPRYMGLTHGLVAALGLILLIIAVVLGSMGTFIIVALILFIISALGGFVLFSKRLRDKDLPKPLMALHSLAAIVGYIFLLIGGR